jgi:hypothetical protein
MPGPKKKREPSGRDMDRRYQIRCFAPVAKDVEGLLSDPVSISLADLPAGRYIWVWAGAPGTRQHLELLVVATDERDNEICKPVLALHADEITAKVLLELPKRLRAIRGLVNRALQKSSR